MRVVDAVAQAISTLDRPHCFGIVGDGNLDLVVALTHDFGVPWVAARHEQGAVAMADGYSRSRRGVGVALVTHGPGLTNAATSIREAQAAGSSVLVVAGDTPAGDDEHFQHLPQLEFARTLVDGATARPACIDDVAEVVGQAITHVHSDRGPFILHLPTDVQEAEVEPPIPQPSAVVRTARVVPDVEAIERAQAALCASKRPLLLLGRGSVMADAAQPIEELAERLGAPMFTTLRAVGTSHDHPLAHGIAGGFGREACAAAFDQADLVVALGASLNRYTTRDGRLINGKPVVRVDHDGVKVARRGDVVLRGDAKLAVEALLADMAISRAEPWFRAPRVEADRTGALRHGDGTVDPTWLFKVVDKQLPARRRVVVDAGHFTTFACGLLRFRHPDDLIFPVNFGAVGQGLATAIGTAVGHRGERVLAVTGDGGFMLALAELDTAIRLDLPLTVLVVNDEAYGQEVHVMRARGLPVDTARIPSPDIASIAQAMGGRGVCVQSPADLDILVEHLDGAGGVAVIDARVNPAVRNWRLDERFGSGTGRC